MTFHPNDRVVFEDKRTHKVLVKGSVVRVDEADKTALVEIDGTPVKRWIRLKDLAYEDAN